MYNTLFTGILVKGRVLMGKYVKHLETLNLSDLIWQPLKLIDGIQEGLLNLLSCLPFGLQTGFSSFSKLAQPS